jgi:hypothetical protein
VLDGRSLSYWDNGHTDWELEKARVRSHVAVPATAAGSTRGWRVDPGEYDLLIGTSSNRIRHRLTVTAG